MYFECLLDLPLRWQCRCQRRESVGPRNTAAWKCDGVQQLQWEEEEEKEQDRRRR